MQIIMNYTAMWNKALIARTDFYIMEQDFKNHTFITDLKNSAKERSGDSVKRNTLYFKNNK